MSAYFDGELTEALTAFRDTWSDYLAVFEKGGAEPKPVMRRYYQEVCDQVRLPPGVMVPEGFEVL